MKLRAFAPIGAAAGGLAPMNRHTQRRTLLAVGLAGIAAGCAVRPESTGPRVVMATGCSPADQIRPYARLPEFEEFTYRGDAGRVILVEYSTRHPEHALPMDPLLEYRSPDVRRAALASVSDRRPPEDVYALDNTVKIGRLDLNSRHPVHVQRVAMYANYALRRFAQFSLRPPSIADNEIYPRRARIRLVRQIENLNVHGGTTRSWDHIEIFHGLSGDQALLSVGHELFHQIQFDYGRRVVCTGGTQFEQLIIEGGARFIEDILFDGFDRYADDAIRLFSTPGVSLSDRSDGRENEVSASYAGGLFWKYVGEQHGRIRESRGNGVDALELVLKQGYHQGSTGGGPYDVNVLRQARLCMAGIGDFDRITCLDNDRRQVVEADTTFGNFAIALALNGTASRDSRYRFRESRNPLSRLDGLRLRIPSEFSTRFRDLPEWPETGINLGGRAARAAPADRRMLQFLFQEPRTVGTDAIQPYSVTPYEVRLASDGLDTATLRRPHDDGRAVELPDDAADSSFSGIETLPLRLLRIEFEPLQDELDALVQVLVLDTSGTLLDIMRHDCSPTLGTENGQRTMDLTLDTTGAGRILILVCGRERAGGFRMNLSRRRRVPLIVSTSWNAREFTNHTADPARYTRTWRSPSMGRIGNSLYVAVRNVGDRPAREVTAQFDWRRPGAPDWLSLGSSAPRDVPPVDWLRRSIPRSDASDSLHPDSRWQLQARLSESAWSDLNAGAIVRARLTVPNDPNRARGDLLTSFGSIDAHRLVGSCRSRELQPIRFPERPQQPGGGGRPERPRPPAQRAAPPPAELVPFIVPFSRGL